MAQIGPFENWFFQSFKSEYIEHNLKQITYMPFHLFMFAWTDSYC